MKKKQYFEVWAEFIYVQDIRVNSLSSKKDFEGKLAELVLELESRTSPADRDFNYLDATIHETIDHNKNLSAYYGFLVFKDEKRL